MTFVEPTVLAFVCTCFGRWYFRNFIQTSLNLVEVHSIRILSLKIVKGTFT